MKPLFTSSSAQSAGALFVYGELLHGQRLAWVLSESSGMPAQLRGRLWRLHSGTVLFSLDPSGVWVHGEIHVRPLPRVLALVGDLLTGPGLQPAFVSARARMGLRALSVQVWAAPAEQLGKARAHRLRGGDWRRLAPGE